jgi:hypothetical protein
MNPTVNRFAESPQPSSDPSAQSSARESQSPSPETGASTRTAHSTPADPNPVTPTVPLRNHPIPPPSEPRQYRAIGLIRGCYQPTEESLTRGTLMAADGTPIDAVLLGRAIGVVKNHLDLTVPHLWVVYPRTRKEEEDLHVQIVGVWEPEVLGPKTEPSPDSPVEDALAAVPAPEPEAQPTTPEPESESQAEPTLSVRDGYFSIRGEAIFYSQEAGKLIIKVEQAPRKESDRSRYFKLTLTGTLPSERALGHFWDVQAMLQGNTLAIEEATDIGAMPVKKRNKFSKDRKFAGRGHKPGPYVRREGKPTGQSPSQPPNKVSRPTPVSKPAKPIKPPRIQKKEGD